MPHWKNGTDCDDLGIRGTTMDIAPSYAPGQDLFGVYRSPIQFVEAALEAKHPVDCALYLPPLLLDNIKTVLKDGPALTSARRKLEILKVRKLALSLQNDEELLHEKLHKDLQPILLGKNLLLWKHLMIETGFDDPSLFDEVINGFHLVGQATCSPQFPRGHQPMQRLPCELRAQSVWLRRQSVAKCVSSGDPALDELVWKQTMDEVSNAWLSGPFTEAEVSKLVGDPYWLATRRFPLIQSDKVRLIDDALASGLNSGFGTSNKLQLFDVDVLVATILHLQRSMPDRSPLWGPNPVLLGRTLDQQLGAFAEQKWQRVLAVYDPTAKAPRYFIAAALMFGSTAAVYGFNRVSRSLWHILAVKLRLLRTVYYDDFPSIEFEETSESATACTAELLDLLGWKFAREGKKAKPFASVFDVLGIQVDLSRLGDGQLVLQNKPTRVSSLLDSFEHFMDRKRVLPSEAASIHGILNFTQGQFMGAPLKPAMQFFSRVSSSGWSSDLLEELLVVCSYAIAILRVAKPRTITLNEDPRPVVLFTDGAWEPGATCPAGAGMVLIDPVTGLRVVHEICIPDKILFSWKAKGKAQLIAELELLALVIAFRESSAVFRRRRVLVFVDNNAIRDAVAKGTSRSISIFVLLAELHVLFMDCHCLPWISRAPSKSNISDYPSRKQAGEAALQLGAQLGSVLTQPDDLREAICGGTSFLDYMVRWQSLNLKNG